jgi:3-hydroxyisobutyrate dehydrogenase
MTRMKIAMLGLGAMGSRMVQNLLRDNYSVVVYNRTAEKAKPWIEQGAIFAATPREAASQADVVISMVTDDAASRSTWLDPETGAISGLRKDAIAIESSTLTVGWTQELAATITKQGANFLDAPVVGSRPQAEAGKLIYLVGGNANVLEKIRPILISAGGASIYSLGAVGQGMAMKLAVNALFGIQVAALAEVLSLLRNQGVAQEQALNCLGELPVLSPAAKLAGGLMLTQNHAPLFPISLVEKDFRYVSQLAQTVNAEVPIATAIGEIFQDAVEQGLGTHNITGIMQRFT